MKYRLLIVEDEKHLAFALEYNLSAEGYDVDVAPDVATARQLVSRSPDLVLLDVMLPDGNGFDFCREIRTAGVTVPVMFLTAKGSLDDIVHGLEAGGDDYVTKPFALQELMGRVKAILRRRTWDGATRATVAPGAGAYRFAEHEIHWESREAFAWGRPASLTDLEFRMLRYFADNPGRVIPREELLANVWEVSPELNTRTVDVFMARLRRVFEREPAHPQHFLTVRGAGYRFVPKP